MVSKKSISTKEKIFNEAIRLFSDNGYSEVSVRDIASNTGINVSSLYFHYPSKEEILSMLYDYYMKNWKAAAPDIAHLLKLCETAPVFEIFEALDFRFPPEVKDKMNRIVKIAVRQMTICSKSENFIRERFLKDCTEALSVILDRLILLNRIEPFDINAFVCLVSRYAVCAAIFNSTTLEVKEDEWRAGLSLAFSLIKPK